MAKEVVHDLEMSRFTSIERRKAWLESAELRLGDEEVGTDYRQLFRKLCYKRAKKWDCAWRAM